ncbi:MAG: hypothetical protein ACOCWH_03650 [Spirochaetota bacterium]
MGSVSGRVERGSIRQNHESYGGQMSGSYAVYALLTSVIMLYGQPATMVLESVRSKALRTGKAKMGEPA